MKKYTISALYLLVLVLLLANCVREIDFQQDSADQSDLVVSGTFTDGHGPHILRLSRPGNYNKQAFAVVSGASVRLKDDAGNVYVYQEVTPAGEASFYQLEAQGETGRSYTLEIEVDGEHYQSHPQIMPEPFTLDTVEAHGEWLYSNTSNGTVVREPFAVVYARTKAPAVTKGHYLHWDSEAIYVFNEILPKPYKPLNPYGSSRQCFINNRINDQIVGIADMSKYAPGGTVYEPVGKRKIDNAFLTKIAFAVYQRSVNREAYEYWEKINKLLTATGTIFDSPPAVVAGNMENTTHPNRPALGFFEVGAADTVRIFSGNGQLGDEFLLQDNIYCEIDWSKYPQPPVNYPECDDCLKWLRGAYYEVPWWWQ